MKNLSIFRMQFLYGGHGCPAGSDHIINFLMCALPEGCGGPGLVSSDPFVIVTGNLVIEHVCA